MDIPFSMQNEQPDQGTVHQKQESKIDQKNTLVFTHSRSAQSAADEELLRRRTKRVRREKPNYYDSQEFDKKKKKKDRRVTKSFLSN